MRHNSGAPRLIDWTGERCVPWAPDIQVVYEHLHRYMWAARLVTGRRVLDLASGEGFGAAILAESAASVVGVDVDQTTVDHSQLNYGGEDVEFRCADARDLSSLEPGSFGAVIAFEMIEHVDDQDRVLDEIHRVLAPDGLLIISTPDSRAYSDATGQSNPFHVHELDGGQFGELLQGKFAHVAIRGQRTITGSSLSTVGDEPGENQPTRTFFVQREGDGWSLAAGLSPLYLVAVASNAELPPIPSDSTLADADLALIRAAEAAGSRAVQERVEEAESARISSARELERRDRELERRARELEELRSALSDRAVELQFSHQEAVKLLARAESAERELVATRQLTARIQYSASWKVFQRLRDTLLASLGGQDSLTIRALKRTLRVVRAVQQSGPRAALATAHGDSPIELPEFDHPQVSIVIPAYSGAELTQRCLESIAHHTSGVSYEVIVVDDAADKATKALLARVRGARIVVNRRNVGYLQSVNLGASRAAGRWIVLCNNDIEVFEGWLSAMVACGESSSEIGIVTPKYLYPDGSLSEAGSIVWRDGSAGNYGRGDEPSDCRYEFRREVDYGSAAALMVRSDLWRDVGGFDRRFEPMYYEDTDLCFEARERGLKVVYEPRANVVHVEGGTVGTDTASGHKRYQEVNRHKFAEKWRHRLEREQLRPGERNVRRASNRQHGPHVLIIDHRVPMWDRDSGSLRMLGMIRALIDLGCRVTLLPDDRHLVLPYTVDLMSMGVEVWYGEVDVSAELAAVGPDLALVITCRPHTSSRWLDLLRERAPTTPVVYDTVDLHWLREARRSGSVPGGEQIALGPKAMALREIELALIRATDATLVVSPEERSEVQADVPGALVKVVPNVNPVTEHVPPPEARKGVLFIGSFEHTPNVDAAVRLVTGVMPRVWQALGDVPVAIVGADPPAEVRELASSLVDVTGWVQDVGPLFDATRAMVAPLNYGAGLKGKVTQALAAGVPVVTTPIGAEGLEAIDGEQLMIGNDDRELAERVIRALSDDALWAALSSAGQRLAAERCSPAFMAQQLGTLLAERTQLGPPAKYAATRG